MNEFNENKKYVYYLSKVFANSCLNGNNNHLIEKLSPYSNLYQNSITLSIGPPGTSKTTHFMREMFVICQTDFSHIDKIFYISDTPNDQTFERMKDKILIPIHAHKYNDFIDGIEEEMLFKLNDNKTRDLQTIIFCDDAARIFNYYRKKNEHDIIKFMTKLRHYKCNFFINIQSAKMISTDVKELVSVVFLAPGITEQRLKYLFSQLTTMSIPFEDLKYYYNQIKNKYDKLMIDCREGIMEIIESD
jgi:hypothetical protein